MTKTIKTKSGHLILVDDCDYSRVMRHNWHTIKNASGVLYAASSVDGSYMLLHRFITGVEKGLVVDHKNGDTLDCRRSNLRVCTRSQNRVNSKKNSNSKQPYKGIVIRPSGRWTAYITIDGKYQGIGTFDTAEQAAKARDEKAAEIYGEFDRPNFKK